jgi:RES domain-containing protein
MATSDSWDPDAALRALRGIAWKGTAWRFHRHAYSPTDAGGSLLVSGRYHRGADQFARSDAWSALYLALAPEVSLGEVLRHFSPALMPRLSEYRLTELAVELAAVLDCRDERALGLAAGDLVEDYDFTRPQAIAAAAIDRGAEAMLVRSATGLGDNLVVFPASLRQSSALSVVGSRDPRLYVPRG